LPINNRIAGKGGSNIVALVAQDGSNAAAASADAGDVETLLTALASGPRELQAAMEKHGVLMPLVIYVEK
jgi:hypothetical protein